MNFLDCDTPYELMTWIIENITIKSGSDIISITNLLKEVDLSDKDRLERIEARCGSISDTRYLCPDSIIFSKRATFMNIVELERLWFQFKGIPHDVLFLEGSFGDRRVVHSTLIYESNREAEYSWSWFEVSPPWSLGIIADTGRDALVNHIQKTVIARTNGHVDTVRRLAVPPNRKEMTFDEYVMEYTRTQPDELIEREERFRNRLEEAFDIMSDSSSQWTPAGYNKEAIRVMRGVQVEVRNDEGHPAIP